MVFQDDYVLIFADTDGDGNITEYIAGSRVIPHKQYEHFFYVEKFESSIDTLRDDYKIIFGELVRKEV